MNFLKDLKVCELRAQKMEKEKAIHLLLLTSTRAEFRQLQIYVITTGALV